MVDKVKTIEWGRVLQITLSLIALIAWLEQCGRILERTEATKTEIVNLINHNESTRDLKDSNQANRIADLEKRLAKAEGDYEKLNDRVTRTRELVIASGGKLIPKEVEDK